MPDTLTTMEVVTRRYIDGNPKLRDLVYNKDPLMSFLEDNCLDEVDGGSSWNDNVEYDVQDGGAYLMGSDLPADQRQLEQQLRFTPKFQTVMIPFLKEEIKVINTGTEAVVKIIESRTDSAYMQLGAQTALQLYLQGQTGNYVGMVNALTEALNDGTTAGLDGATYPIYGTLTRATYGGRMIPPAPTAVNGAITLSILEDMYQSVNFGTGEYEPNLIVTTPRCQGFIRKNYQTQQRFVNVSVGKAGFRGLEYDGAVIVAGRYVPGSYLQQSAGTNDRVAQRFFTYTTKGAVTRYPSLSGNIVNGVEGESLWMLNARKPMIKYRRSKNSPYNGNLDDDGFIPSAGNTKIVGKVLLAHNASVLPGYHTYAMGITS